MFMPNIQAMKMRISAIAALGLAIGCLALPALGADKPQGPQTPENKIYRTTDSQGHAVFSDTAPEGSPTVEVDQPQTYPAARYDDKPGATAGKKAEASSRVPYTTMRITEPRDQTSIRSNPGNVKIAFELKPGPMPGQKLELLIDGKPVQEVQSLAPIGLTNVDRGTHSVQLQAVDIDTGRVLQSSDTVTFTLHRFSILNQPKNRPKNPPKI